MNISVLKESNTTIIKQLKDLLEQLPLDAYAKPLDLLSGNSIGKHLRHVIELYQEFFAGLETGEINYDQRKRIILLETERNLAKESLQSLLEKLAEIKEDASILVKANFVGEAAIHLPSSISRELAYNLEHAIHHMAIIQICVKHTFITVQLSSDFGLAYSTFKYNKSNVHANLSATSE
jgi:uncharacterized damage-inducible protein DinB